MSTPTPIRLGPELLIYQVSELKAELDRALGGLSEGAPLCLDARNLADIDGAGLQLLALLKAELTRRGSSLALQGLSEDLVARIDSSGLAELIGMQSRASAPATGVAP